MAFVRDTVAAFFRNLDADEAAAALLAVPDLAERIPFPVVGPRLLGVFYVTLPQGRLARTLQTRGLGPFPSLMTTDPAAAVGVDIRAPNFFFGGNRAEGLVLRINPGASMTVWRHVQVFRNGTKKATYPVDLGFVLGISDGENRAGIRERLVSLLEHTISVWSGIDWEHRGQ